MADAWPAEVDPTASWLRSKSSVAVMCVTDGWLDSARREEELLLLPSSSAFLASCS